MSAAQNIDWLNLVEKTGPFLAVGVLDEAFPQGLEKVETRRRQRVRSAYDEWRAAVDEADPQLAALHQEWVRLVLEELLEYEPSVLKSGDSLPATLAYREPLTGVEVKPDFAVLSGDRARLLITRYAPDTDLSAPIAGETWAASPIERMSQACWKLREATSRLLVLITTAGVSQRANPKQRARLIRPPHRQPSFLAIGFPSSTMWGVATQVLRKSIPRANSSSASIQ